MFLQLVHKCYKDCAVPQCKSNTSETPYKLFFNLPQNKELRKRWLTLARVLGPNPEDIPAGTRTYFCADHFDLSNDMINYMDYYKSGSATTVSLIKGCMPSKFECQHGRTLPSHTPQDNSDNKQDCYVTLPKPEPTSSFVSAAHSITNAQLLVKEEMDVVKEDMLNVFSSNVADTDTVTVKIEKTNDESNGIEELVETKEGIKRHTVIKNNKDCTIKKSKVNIEKINKVNKNTDMLFRSCDVCYEMVFSKDYTKHLLKEHAIKNYSCKTCNKMLKSAFNLKRHNRVHLDKKHKCEICYKGFTKACYLASHKFEHEEERYACNMCDAPFVLLNQLRAHVRAAHKGNRRSKASKQDHVSGMNSVSGFNFTNQVGDPLTAREEIEDEKEKTTLNHSSNNESFTVTVKNEITNDLPTKDEEGKLVKDNYIVNIEKCHIKTEIEMNEDTNVDNRNGHVFSEKIVKIEVRNDLSTEDEEVKLVKDNYIVNIEKCDIKTEVEMNENTDVDNRNGHVFSEKTVKIEMRSDLPTEDEEVKLLKDNTIVNIEKCDIKTEIEMNEDTVVDYTSHENNSRDYESHLNIHTQNTLYPCKICHQTFSRASRLKEHTYVHKRQQPFACNLCDKTYSSVFDLDIHVLVHGTRCCACTKCDKTFTRTYDLMVHMRKHTGQKQHACTSCDKTFAFASSLKVHMSSHKEEPFACDLCNETFDVESLLEEHKRDHDTVKRTVTKSHRRYGRLKRSQNILVKDVQCITENDFSKNVGDSVTGKEETM